MKEVDKGTIKISYRNEGKRRVEFARTTIDSEVLINCEMFKIFFVFRLNV